MLTDQSAWAEGPRNGAVQLQQRHPPIDDYPLNVRVRWITATGTVLGSEAVVESWARNARARADTKPALRQDIVSRCDHGDCRGSPEDRCPERLMDVIAGGPVNVVTRDGEIVLGADTCDPSHTQRDHQAHVPRRISPFRAASRLELREVLFGTSSTPGGAPSPPARLNAARRAFDVRLDLPGALRQRAARQAGHRLHTRNLLQGTRRRSTDGHSTPATRAVAPPREEWRSSRAKGERRS